MATKMTKNIGTISLTANEIERVTLPASYGFVWVKNMSDGDIYFSLNDEFTAGEDGVIDIPKGECARLQGDTSTVYLLGSGSAIVVAQNFSSCPFKLAAKGGEGGGSSPEWNVDSALSLFSENPVQNKVITSEINKKANVVDIPSSLPANGGNADTVNGHSVNADVPENAVFTDTVPDLSAYAKKTDVPNIKVNSAGNADTVGGHNVGIDVPANAVFTDTTYDVATITADGLMSAADKTKLNNVGNTYALKSKYGDTTIDVGRKAGTTTGIYSTAEGLNTNASGEYSHAEGVETHATEQACHAEGWGTKASGWYSHAEGAKTNAKGYYSHAGGQFTNALHDCEVAYGQYNESNVDTLFSIGDGTSDSDRHNAFEITKTGGILHDKDILTSAHCIQFIPHNMKYYAQNDRILLFCNDDAVTRGIYFVNNTPNDIVVCALISATGSGPMVQYGYGSNTYPEIQNTGEGREWFSEESIPTSPTIFSMVVPSGKLGYYGVYHNSESAYTTIHDINCPYFNFF